MLKAGNGILKSVFASHLKATRWTLHTLRRKSVPVCSVSQASFEATKGHDALESQTKDPPSTNIKQKLWC
jgi:hypothetical protein